MAKSKLVVSVVVIFGLTSITARAATPTYYALYVFGDSYCDVGNIYGATAGAIPAAPYYNGRFSNGPIWLDHVAGFLGVPLTASLLGGTDYAFGGAWVTAPQPIAGGSIPSVPEQVGLYLLQHGGKADPKALYVIEGGGNDILDTTTGTPLSDRGRHCPKRADVAPSRRKELRNSKSVQCRYPALGCGKHRLCLGCKHAANKYIRRLLVPEEELPVIHILRMNVFTLMNAVTTDPTHFGFTDPTDPCLTTSLCADPDHTFFWDTHHPTEFGHVFFAVTLENVMADQSD